MKEKEYDLRDFKFEDVMDECEKYESIEEQVDYLFFVEKKWISENPLLDPNGPGKPNFTERIRAEIELRENRSGRKSTETEGSRIDADELINKIKLPDGKGSADLVRIFETMKKVEIIDKNTKVTEIAELFEVDRETFASNYYATRSGIKSYKHNSISDKLYKFIIEIIREAYKDRPNKRDELIEEIEKI